LCIEHRTQLARLHALASDKPEFFQSLCKERSNMLLAVGDADARRDFSPAERGKLGCFFDSLTIHAALLRDY
jgi:hypothetical protein